MQVLQHQEFSNTALNVSMVVEHIVHVRNLLIQIEQKLNEVDTKASLELGEDIFVEGGTSDLIEPTC